MAASLIAACGSSSDDDASSGDTPTTAAGGSPSAAGELDRDAELVFTYKILPATLDPHLERNQGWRPYWRPAYDTLTDDVNGEIQPSAAESFTPSDDGLTWTFTLREGMTFHDGSPVNAEAVVASLERAQTHPESAVAGVLSGIVDVEATDELTVVITTEALKPELPAVLAGPAGAIINPAAIDGGVDLAVDSAGSGPYEIAEFVRETRVVFERFEGYWDEAANPLAKATIEAVGDMQAALNGVESGQYDVAWVEGSGAQMRNVVESNDLELYDVRNLGPDALWLASTRGDLADARVREAVSLAINREALIEGLYDGGTDCVATSQIYDVETLALFIPDRTEPLAHDVEGARSLLEEAGAVGTSITITESGTTLGRNTIQALQAQLEEAGFSVNLEPGNSNAPQQMQQQQVDAWLTRHSEQGHPLLTLKRYWLPGGAYQMLRDDNVAAVQELVDEVLSGSLSEDETAEAYREISAALNDLNLVVPLCQPISHVVSSVELTDLRPINAVLDIRGVGVPAEG